MIIICVSCQPRFYSPYIYTVMNLTALVRRICAAIGRVYPFETQSIKTIRRRLLLPRANALDCDDGCIIIENYSHYYTERSERSLIIILYYDLIV